MIDLEPTAMAIRAAMSRLPQTQIEAVQLRIADDLPYSEVARILGCSEGAARVRVSRGLTTLAAQLGDRT